MPARACADCGAITTAGSRCPTHARTRERARHRAEYDTPAWRWARGRAMARHRRRWGDLCPGWNRKPHLAGDLTVDHIVPLAAGGHLTDPANLQVLCRSCNGRKA